MASDKSFELKVGLFVGIGLVIFFIIVFSIGDVTFVKKGYRVNMLFNFVDGITESAPVRLAGVDVGRIESINIYFDENEQKTKVKVTAWIASEDREIESDSIAVINTLGLLGEKYLEIFPGNVENGILKNDDTITSQDPIMMRNVTDSLNQLAENANTIVERLKAGKGTIGKLLTEETIYNDLEAFVADIKAHPWKLLNRPRGSRE